MKKRYQQVVAACTENRLKKFVLHWQFSIGNEGSVTTARSQEQWVGKRKEFWFFKPVKDSRQGGIEFINQGGAHVEEIELRKQQALYVNEIPVLI